MHKVSPSSKTSGGSGDENKFASHYSLETASFLVVASSNISVKLWLIFILNDAPITTDKAYRTDILLRRWTVVCFVSGGQRDESGYCCFAWINNLHLSGCFLPRHENLCYYTVILHPEIKNASCYMFSESQERIAVMKGKSLDDLTSLQSTQANTENIANYVKHWRFQR